MRPKRQFFGLWAAALGALYSFPALACPLCHSSRADEVRAGILATFSEGGVVLGVLLPFLLLSLTLPFLRLKLFSTDHEEDFHE